MKSNTESHTEKPSESIQTPISPVTVPYRTKESEGKFVHRFVVDGRASTLYKLVETKTAPWYVAFQCRRRRIQRSLESSTVAEAVKRATLLIRKARAERWDELAGMKARQEYPTLSHVVEVYRLVAPLTIKERTMRNNIAMLSHVIQIATGRTAWEQVSTGDLTGRLVRQFKERFVEQRLLRVPQDKIEQERRRA